MNNHELIKQVLTDYFSDFKEYHLIILLAFTVIIAAIQIAQAMWVSREIEKFKNELKKSEIKFSRYNEMQIKILSESYHFLSNFHESTINTAHSGLSPEIVNKRAKKWFEDYYNFHKHYSQNKFIFPSKIKVKLSEIFISFEKMKSIVKIEQDNSKIHYTDESGEVQFVGDYEDLVRIHNELNKLNKNDTIKFAIDNIGNLKKDIEDYFTKLEG